MDLCIVSLSLPHRREPANSSAADDEPPAPRPPLLPSSPSHRPSSPFRVRYGSRLTLRRSATGKTLSRSLLAFAPPHKSMVLFAENPLRSAANRIRNTCVCVCSFLARRQRKILFYTCKTGYDFRVANDPADFFFLVFAPRSRVICTGRGGIIRRRRKPPPVRQLSRAGTNPFFDNKVR